MYFSCSGKSDIIIIQFVVHSPLRKKKNSQTTENENPFQHIDPE